MQTVITAVRLLLVCTILLVPVLVAPAATAETIAIAADGDNPDAAISPMAGKAPWYLIFDEQGAFVQAKANPGRNSDRDSSAAVISLLREASCATVVAGRFGGKLRARLDAENIAYLEQEGSVRAALKRLTPAHEAQP